MEINHSYLVKEKTSYNSEIRKIKVIEITDKCYHIQWFKNDLSSYYEWILKTRINDEFNIIEDLGILLNSTILNQFK